MSRASLLVALVMVLAGCGGVVPSESPETVTPAPVPTDEFRYPPGVTSERVVPSTLTSAHVGALATTNYTLTTRQVVRGTDGTLLRETSQTRAVARDGEAYRGRFSVETDTFNAGRQASEIAFWSNRSVIATRYTSLEPQRDTEIRQWPVRGGAPITDLTDEHHLEGNLAGATVAPTTRTPDGGVLLAGSGIRDRASLIIPLVVSNPRNLTLQMRVRYDGVVLTARVAYDATHNGQPVSVEHVMRVTDVGSTAVERPAWATNGTAGSRYAGYF